tara:strand:- start:284 stop:1207 length:924 start_codon:yes stop_codon:yes gene_type:complete
MKTFVHIGFPKSASTFLQKKIFSKNGHINYIKDPSFYEYLYAKKKVSEKIRKRFIDNFIKKEFSTSKINIISAEIFVMPNDCLFTHPRDNDWKKILPNKEIMQNLKSLPIDYEIIMIIRNQRSWLISWYQERVKRLETKSFQNWLGSKEIKNTLKVIDFYETLKLWKKFFIKRKISIIPFELLKNDSEKFIKEISKILGVKINIDDKSIVKSGISKRAIFFKRKINILGGILVTLFGKKSLIYLYFSRANKKIMGLDFLLSKLFKGRVYHSLNSKLASHYESKNKLLDRHLKLDLERYNYFDLNSKD